MDSNDSHNTQLRSSHLLYKIKAAIPMLMEDRSLRFGYVQFKFIDPVALKAHYKCDHLLSS